MPCKKYLRLREEPLKSAVRQDFFDDYRYTQLGNIDFVIAKHDTEKGSVSLFEDLETGNLKSLLWAEAKQGTNHDIYESFVQLILTIGKERTFEKFLPPKYIGAFDAEKFAFIGYHGIQHIFYQNDFNWNVTPSNHGSKEFVLLYGLCESLLEENSILFRYETQGRELRDFIRRNFKSVKERTEKISVTKNNFAFVFYRWSETVKPTIAVDWEKANKAGIISADFFLADLLSENGESLKDSLYVVLKNTKYELAKNIDDLGFETSMSVGFKDKQKAYKEFWNIYARPPKEEYWNYIIERRDLLVPQDIRERKGSFFTPRIWVEKSQEYLAKVLGDSWQDEYYVWDCCAGTGNLLNGLLNYDNVWASTLDRQDVDVMRDRIEGGWNMAENHIFQFDFLNDGFEKCPEELREILNDAEKRKKLVIYINPPYAEGDNRKGEGRRGVAEHKTKETYSDFMGYAKREIYVQFMARIYNEIEGCTLGVFSTLTHLTGAKFHVFRNNFKAKIETAFIAPANTFDNVKGNFPIGFQVWNLSAKENFKTFFADVFDADGIPLSPKKIFAYENVKFINDWALEFVDEEAEDANSGKSMGNIIGVANDFQHQNTVCIERPNKPWNHQFQWQISQRNLVPSCVYFSARKCIPHSWLNHNDQFLRPVDAWKNDREFLADALIYTIFNGKNFISSSQGVNHWIPFTRGECGSKSTFRSNSMGDFLRKGNLLGFLESGGGFFGGVAGVPPAEGVAKDADAAFARGRLSPLDNLSALGKAVYDSGLELWRYYHSRKDAIPDASFYDIRKYFQGEKNGRMNAGSDDEEYNGLIFDLREKMKALGQKIALKVYEYGFLR